ncbi:hypothetical protein ACF0H5_017135 [Mactra antiquata]
MGNCCGTEEEQRPLLNSETVGARSGTLNNTTPVVTEPPQSARNHNPVEKRDFETSIELISKVQLQTIQITTINKTFQDLGSLYNDVIDNFQSLETNIHNFKEFFVEDTAGIPVLATCVKILVQRAGEAKITIERTQKNLITVLFDSKEIARICGEKSDRVVKPLEYFASACRHIRNVLEHAPQVESNVKIILQEDEKMRKDIMKSDLSQEDIQRNIKALLENVSKMRVVAAGTDTIKRDVEKKFKEFSKASEGFFVEDNQ